jgi:hypothetical protein
MRRLRVVLAVWRGRAVTDPSDAGAATAYAGAVLRRWGRRSAAWPFSRDFVFVAAAAAGLLLLTDYTLFARLALLMLAVACLLVFEIALDSIVARLLANAARAERANVALVLRALGERYERYPKTGEAPKRGLRLVA